MSSDGKIIAGDFPKGSIITKVFSVITLTPSGKFTGMNITNQIKNVEIITEESKKKFVGAAGWGLVGAVALGPLGAIAGILAGGNKKEILVACELKDGKKFIATVDSKLYQSMLSASY